MPIPRWLPLTARQAIVVLGARLGVEKDVADLLLPLAARVMAWAAMHGMPGMPGMPGIV